MKKATLVFGAVMTLLFISCEGPVGPPGFDGFDGQQGPSGQDGLDGIQGQAIEIDGVDFDYDANGNLYSSLLTYEDYTNLEVFESYAVLVYRFDGEIELQDGSTANAWSLIPQNFFLPEGTIQYTNAHTFFDTEIFIDGNFDLTNLDTSFTQNQFFRIVFVPGTFLTSKMDKSNINNVMESLNIAEEDVLRSKVN